MKWMRFGVLAWLLGFAVHHVFAQTMPYIVFDWYAGESADTMTSRHRFTLVTATNTGETTIPMSPDCFSAPVGTCRQVLPVYPSGTTLRLSIMASCASSPTLYGPSSQVITWTVGTPLPDAPVYVPPPPSPCVPPIVTPPPPPPPSSCTLTVAGTDALGHVWTIGAGGWTLRDGQYSLPGGGSLPGANGSAYTFVNGVVHVKDSRDGLWYGWNESTLNWVLDGSSIPACAPPPPLPPEESCRPDGTGNDIDEDMDGLIDETCLPPPLPPAPHVSGSVRSCTWVLGPATRPLGWPATGNTAQFRRNGKNIGTADSSAPYQRTVEAPPGAATWDIVWTRGTEKIISAVTASTGPGCQ